MAHYLCGVGRSCEIVEVSEKKTSIIEVFSPIRKNPYPPAGYTAGRVLEELADVLRQKRTTLIFCNTRGGAESIGHRLKLTLPELAEQIEVHHASLDREIRLQVEDRLKAGDLRAVVCSTSLEMGIDIGSIDLVVMVSAPKGVARALQRLGRSGHSRHDMSHGLLVATNVNDLVECAVTAKLMETKELEPVRVPETPVDVLAQHLVSWAVPCDLTTDQAYARATRAWNFRHLTRTQFDRVLQYLQGGGASLEKQYADRFGKIALENGRLVIPRPRITREFYQNVGTISSDTMISVKLGRKRLGTVEERFLKGLQLGDVFVLNGQCVRLVETRMLEAKVTHARGELPTVPRWNANKMPLQSGLAREVVRLRSHLSRFLTVRNPQFENPGQPVGTAIPNAIAWLVEEYALTASNAEAIVRQYAAQARVSLIPTEDTFLIEIFREENRRHIFFHSLIGRSANDALSRIITWRVKQQCGGNALVTIDDYGFLLTLRQEQQLDLEAWKELFRPAGAAEDLHAILQDSELVRWQFSGVAQTGLMVPRQLNGAERQPKALQWTADIIYEVLQKYEPDHPLLEEAYREATHKFLDFPRALEFLERSQALDWKQVEVPKVSPLAFGIFVSKIKETMMLEDPEEAIERLYQQMYQDVVGDGK
jgi:ATP-dependent Lhr-like helicase